MSEKLIIPFDGKTEKEVDETPLTGFISWDRLAGAIQALELKINENLVGLVVDKGGITLKIETTP